MEGTSYRCFRKAVSNNFVLRSFTDKYHWCLCQFASTFYFCSLFVDRKKTMENVLHERTRLLIVVLNIFFNKSY